MGNICCGGYSEEQKKSRAINKFNKSHNLEEESKIKMLLLGSGESGKSTLFKQMKILYSTSTFSDKERRDFVPVIRHNIRYNISVLVGKDVEVSKAKEVYDAAKASNEKLQVRDVLDYFLGDAAKFEQILKDDYLPTDQDVLRCRIRTSGIVEEEFGIDGNKFVMVDVGGQRNERRKWIHAFDNVDCILFVAAISEFDETLFEDNSMSRQEESLNLFKKVCSNDDVFKDTQSIILFLNKIDLFKKKILSGVPFRSEEKKRNLSFTGLEFTPEVDSEEVIAQSVLYLEQLYRAQVPKTKTVFIKTTCATDTQQMKTIMEACKEMLLKRNLVHSGFAS